mmetsp:Transcript_83545/g.217579  ORF Transcript_83545/g.217579 Transcript_83545/m.217579 type:complete len:168 (-) Transcript_83545:85-588(-)
MRATQRQDRPGFNSHLSCNADSNAVHSKDDAGTTALILAARNGHVEVVKILIAANADVLCQVNSGYTAIHAAAQGCRISEGVCRAERGHFESAEALLEAKADLKLTSQAGFTSLHFAATSGNAALVQLLLQARAAVKSKTSKGKTALKLATARKDTAVVQVLRDAAA